MKKKPTKRNQTQYPALDKKVNLRSRIDLLDYDYLDKLNAKELAWLNKFTEEDVHASFGQKPLHKDKKQKKNCYDRNNARNRDIMTRAKAQGKCLNFSDIYGTRLEKSTEDLLINQFDIKFNKTDTES